MIWASYEPCRLLPGHAVLAPGKERLDRLLEKAIERELSDLQEAKKQRERDNPTTAHGVRAIERDGTTYLTAGISNALEVSQPVQSQDYLQALAAGARCRRLAVWFARTTGSKQSKNSRSQEISGCP